MTALDARRAAFDGLIDHAPLFPPASLAPPDAVSDHQAARSSDRSTVLARLVWPAATLDELLALLPPDATPESPWPVSVLLASPDEAAAMVPLAGGPLRAEQVEVRLVGEGDVPRLDEALAAAGAPEVRRVFELGLDGEWEPALEQVAKAGATAKVRTGGATPDSVPTVERLGRFIVACAAAQVPFKATAGLHHPFWNSNGHPQHGFFAVLLATALASRGEDVSVVSACLSDEASAFGAVEDGLRWRDVWLEPAEVAAVRESGFRGFGSCSFSEPVAELEKLAWLP